MITVRWQFPDEPLRTSAVTAKLAGLTAVVGLACVARAGLQLGELYPFKASCVFAVVMLLAIGFLPVNHPFARFGPANQITTARAVLVALVASLIGEPRLPIAAVSAAAASLLFAVLDGADGWLARRSRMASDFGARFDMEIDSLLIMVLAIFAWRYGKAGPWVVLSGLLRYLFVAGGWLWDWLQYPLPPSRRRQTIYVIQVIGLILAILPGLTPPLSVFLAAVALAALSWSFLVDVVWLRQRAGLALRGN